MRYILNILFFAILPGVFQAQCLLLQTCPSAPVEFCDTTANNPEFWNDSLFSAPAYQSSDLPETAVDLCFTATDTCQGANLDIQYLLFLDLDGNGSRETVVSSADLPPHGTVNFDNAANPNYTGGTAAGFDARPVPAGDQYGFTLETTGTGSDRTACVRWNTANDPGTLELPHLPYGNHRITWLVSDGLGNEDSCSYDISVNDCEAPLLTCINGLSANIMPTGIITLWDTDFFQFAEDNSTPGNLLQTAIRKSGTGSGFPLDGTGDPQRFIVYDCNELGSQMVELWVRDLAGNTAFCESPLVLNDNSGYCNNNAYIDVSLCIRQWCTEAVVSGVSVESPFPGFSFWELQPDGCYAAQHTSIPVPNYTITPSKDDDPVNGIDILDLIKIQRHILGIEILPGPLSMIAADVNNSRSITTFDIVESRRVLTGVYDSFPNVTSWRFIPVDYSFTNPNNPFQIVFPETIQIISTGDTLVSDFDFWAIKTGDVDCTAIPGLAPEPDDRSVSYLQVPDRQLLAGETFEFSIQFAEAASWLGFQFGLQYDPALLDLEVSGPGDLPAWDEHIVAQPRPGVLNMLWFDTSPANIDQETPLIRLRLQARVPLRLSEALRLASGQLHAEAFTETAEGRNLQLQFLEEKTEQIRIYAPQPNPTRGEGRLRLELPDPAPVQLELWDMRGRQVWSQQLDASEGVLQLEIPETAFPAGGIYLWRVIAGDTAASGRLVVQR